MLRIIALLLPLVENISGAKILALMGVLSHSHHFFNARYLEALAAKGHHVTYLGPDEYEPPENITHVLLEGGYDGLVDYDFSKLSNLGAYEGMIQLYKWDDEISAFQSKSKGLARLREILKKEKFDLVVHDITCSFFLIGAVDAAGRPPVIAITPYGIPTWIYDLLGNPLSHAAFPNYYSHCTNKMNLWQRMDTYFLNLFSSAVFWYTVRQQNKYSKASFGNVRDLNEILDDLNIIIVNSNHATDYPFPKVPGLIQIGGIQITEPKPLPQVLQTYLDKAKHGVIFFGLGSNMKSILLKTDRLQVLIEAFRQLAPIQVLWKWEADTLLGKPDNVKTEKWLPQNDVLAHPNVRLFFTHCGRLSTHEAIYHGKPIVGLPLALDQHSNARNAINRGFGEKIDIDSMTVDEVIKIIKKVLNDPSYTKNARELSRIFRDGMGTPLDEAVYWTEYAIRHKGAPHLRFAGRNLYWYQNWMLDVFLILSVVVFSVLFFIYKIIRMITNSGLGVQKTKKKKS